MKRLTPHEKKKRPGGRVMGESRRVRAKFWKGNFCFQEEYSTTERERK